MYSLIVFSSAVPTVKQNIPRLQVLSPVPVPQFGILLLPPTRRGPSQVLHRLGQHQMRWHGRQHADVARAHKSRCRALGNSAAPRGPAVPLRTRLSRPTRFAVPEKPGQEPVECRRSRCRSTASLWKTRFRRSSNAVQSAVPELYCRLAFIVVLVAGSQRSA
jgi:hypothetical protein